MFIVQRSSRRLLTDITLSVYSNPIQVLFSYYGFYSVCYNLFLNVQSYPLLVLDYFDFHLLDLVLTHYNEHTL